MKVDFSRLKWKWLGPFQHEATVGEYQLRVLFPGTSLYVRDAQASEYGSLKGVVAKLWRSAPMKQRPGNPMSDLVRVMVGPSPAKYAAEFFFRGGFMRELGSSDLSMARRGVERTPSGRPEPSWAPRFIVHVRDDHRAAEPFYSLEAAVTWALMHGNEKTHTVFVHDEFKSGEVDAGMGLEVPPCGGVGGGAANLDQFIEGLVEKLFHGLGPRPGRDPGSGPKE